MPAHTSSHPRDFWAIALLLALPLIILGTTNLPFQARQAHGYVGIGFQEVPDQSGLIIDYIAPGGPADRAGLSTGMRLLAYEGQPVASQKALDQLWFKSPPQQLNLTLQDTGGRQRVYAIAPGRNLDLSQLVVNTLGAFYFFGMMVVLFQQRQKTEARLLILLLLILSMDFLLPFSQVPSQTVNAWLWRINLWNLSAVMVLKLHFVLIFPGPVRFYQQHRRLALALLYGGMLPGLLFLTTLVEDTLDPQSTRFFFTLQVVVMVSIWALLGWRYFRTLNPEWKKQLGIVWAFDTPFAFTQLLWHIHVYYWFMDWLEWLDWTEQLVLALWPTGIFIAIVRHNFLQIRHNLRPEPVRIFIQFALLLVLLLVAQEGYHQFARFMPGNLAMLAISIPALSFSTQIVPASRRLHGWLEHGLLQAHIPLHHAFREHLAKKERFGDDLQQDLRDALQYLRQVLHLPWAGIYCPATEENPAFQVQAGLLPVETASDLPALWQQTEVLMSRHADHLQEIFPLQCSPDNNQGILMLGNSPAHARQLTEEDHHDLTLIAQDLASNIERARLSQLASTDVLTGSLRREAALDALRVLIGQSRRHQTPMSVCMVDLDHFKQVNDQWGHPAGDRVLQNTASTLRQAVRQSDVIGRYGGEEFMLILPECDEKGLQQLMDKIFSQVRQRHTHDSRQAPEVALLSAGCLVLHPAMLVGDTEVLVERMLQEADQLLYQAKAQGRNRYLMGSLSHDPSNEASPTG